MNAALNVLQRGFSELWLEWPEDTPAETALPTDTTQVTAKGAWKPEASGLVPDVIHYIKVLAYKRLALRQPIGVDLLVNDHGCC